MKVIIEINCEGEAFYHPATELKRILTEIAENIRCWPYDEANIPEKPIFDINGNKVGELKIVNA